MAQIGGALGVDLLLASHVGRVGETFVVNMKLIRIRDARVERRVYETVSGKIDKVLQTVKDGVERLFPRGTDDELSGARGKTPPSNTAEVPKSPATAGPPPQIGTRADTSGIGVLPVVLWAGGGVALAAGGFFMVKTRGHAAHANDREFVGGQLEIDKAKSAQTLGRVSFGIGAAAVAGGFVAFLTADRGGAGLAVLPAVASVGFGASLRIGF